MRPWWAVLGVNATTSHPLWWIGGRAARRRTEAAAAASETGAGGQGRRSAIAIAAHCTAGRVSGGAWWVMMSRVGGGASWSVARCRCGPGWVALTEADLRPHRGAAHTNGLPEARYLTTATRTANATKARIDFWASRGRAGGKDGEQHDAGRWEGSCERRRSGRSEARLCCCRHVQDAPLRLCCALGRVGETRLNWPLGR